jgi:hypothetical protein
MPSYSSNSAPHIEIGTYDYVYLNTGSGWATSTLTTPANIFGGLLNGCCQWTGGINYDEPVDWNGDGLPDFADNTSTSTATARHDVLTLITYPGTGTKEVEYKLSSQFAVANPELAFPFS